MHATFNFVRYARWGACLVGVLAVVLTLATPVQAVTVTTSGSGTVFLDDFEQYTLSGSPPKVYFTSTAAAPGATTGTWSMTYGVGGDNGTTIGVFDDTSTPPGSAAQGTQFLSIQRVSSSTNAGARFNSTISSGTLVASFDIYVGGNSIPGVYLSPITNFFGGYEQAPVALTFGFGTSTTTIGVYDNAGGSLSALQKSVGDGGGNFTFVRDTWLKVELTYNFVAGLSNDTYVLTVDGVNSTTNTQRVGGSGVSTAPTLNFLNFQSNQPGSTFFVDAQAEPLLTTTPADGGTLDFGNVRIGTSGTANLTVTNDGSDGLTGDFPSAVGEFSPVGTVAFGPLNAGISDSRTYSYTPSGFGLDTQAVTVESNGGDSTITLAGAGVGPVFDSTPIAGSTIEFGSLAFGQTGTQTLVLENTTGDSIGLGQALVSLTFDDNDLDNLANGFSWTILESGLADSILDPQETATFTLLFTGNGSGLDSNYTLTISTDQGAAFGGNGADFSYELHAFSEFQAAGVVPEPASLALLGLVALPLLARRRGRRA